MDEWPELSTDAEGRFVYEPPSEPAVVTLSVLASGFPRRSVEVVPVAGQACEIELVLEPALTLRGVVVDERGGPVEGARVRTGAGPHEQPVTGPDGRFVLERVEPGRQRDSLIAWKEGYATAIEWYDTRWLEPELRIVLRSGSGLEGRVLGPDERPVPDARLELGYDGPPATLAVTASQKDGTFRFAHVAGGLRGLLVTAPGMAPAACRVDPSSPGAAPIVVRLEKGHRLGGRCVTAAGEPVAMAKVTVFLPAALGGRELRGAETGADGRFELPGLPGRAVDLMLAGAGVATRLESAVEVDRDDHRFVLEPAATLAGKVLDAATGEPVRSFCVRVLRGLGGGWYREGRWFSDAAGSWSVREPVPAGSEVTVEVRAPGYAPGTAVVTAARVPDAEKCTLRLAPGAVVRGRVLDKTSGAPLAGVRVTTFDTLRPLAGGLEHVARNASTTDAAGRFELRSVQVGELSLALDHRDYPRQTDGPFVTVAGERLERTILLLSSARVHGVLVDGEGRPIAGARLLLEHQGGEQVRRGGRTGASGQFAFGFGLVAGAYRVERVFERGDAPCLVAAAEVALELDADREVRLAPLGTCELTVTVTGAEALARDTQIQLSFEGHGGKPATAKAPLHEGQVTFAGLPARTCTAGFWTGSVGARDRIELRPGPRQTLELQAGRIR